MVICGGHFEVLSSMNQYSMVLFSDHKCYFVLTRNYFMSFKVVYDIK